jgi:DNA repair exonuclease SbcCD ATPase subunit
MAKKEETASFVLRFNQKIFENEQGEPQVQWRGNIRHVQSGDEKRFSEYDAIVQFMQGKLADLTLAATKDQPLEEQKGILSKSFDLWKRVAADTPKLVFDTIKDPKKGITQIQSQISQVGDAINEKFESTMGQLPDVDSFRVANKEDVSELSQQIQALTKAVARLESKVNDLVDNNAQ